MTKRFTEKKILKILKEKEDGTQIKDLCAKHGMSSAALYKWKAKYSGMNLDVGDAGHQGVKKKMGKPKKQAVMKTRMRKRFTKKKILKVLKEKEDGARIKDLCAKYGMSSAALYRWRAKYSGMNLGVSDAGHQGDKKKMDKPQKQTVTASPKMMPQDKSTDKPATGFWASVRGFFS